MADVPPDNIGPSMVQSAKSCVTALLATITRYVKCIAAPLLVTPDVKRIHIPNNPDIFLVP